MSTPLLYTIGVSAFAQVYKAFEAAWKAEQDQKIPSLNEDLRNGLNNLLGTQIRRSEIFQQDVSYLRQLAAAVHGSNAAEILNSWQKSEMLQDYLAHISSAISARPHVVIAYAWVMYMALFSGGRWIRMVLKDAGLQFWDGQRPREELVRQQEIRREKPTEGEDSNKGFTFLTFSGPHDGEDIKAAFKQHLASVETLLSDEQKQDIVDEARYIFQKSIDLVHELDNSAVAAMSQLAPTLPAEASLEKKATSRRIVKESLKIEKITKDTLSKQVLQLLLAIVVCASVLAILDVMKTNVMLQGNVVNFTEDNS